MIPLAVRLDLDVALTAVTACGVLAAGFWYGARPLLLAAVSPLLRRGRHAR